MKQAYLQRFAACAAIALICVSYESVACADGPTIEIELVTGDRFSPTKSHEWARALDELGVSRSTVRRKRALDELKIETRGSQKNPTYHITGFLLDDGRIVLPPSSRFGINQKAQIAGWLRNLKQNGPDPPKATPFGLAPERLEDVYKDLKVTASKSTKGVKPREAIVSMAGRLGHRVLIEPAAGRALDADDPVRDELKGLTTGSALAAILRPAGLVLRPRLETDRLEYVVTNRVKEGDNWPIGWTPKKPPGRLIPKLFEKEETQVIRLPLSVALDELSGRVGVPFLLDHNAMARHRIEVAKIEVEMQAGRSHYGAVLRRVLRQAGLRYEPRIDESDAPFLWITSVKR